MPATTNDNYNEGIKEMSASKIKLGDFGLISGPDGPPPDIDPETNNGRCHWEMPCDDSHEISYARVVPDNKRIGAHIHPDAVHYSVILKGSGLLWVEGETQEVHPGDLWYVPKDALHDWFTLPGEPCWIVDITYPPIDWDKMEYNPERDPEIEKAFQKAISQLPKL
jgi:quercetin dioxygenase-like cupin family protein